MLYATFAMRNLHELPLELAEFAPEICVVFAIVSVLFCRLFSTLDRIPSRWVAFAFLIPALEILRVQILSDDAPHFAFGGMLRFDALAALGRGLLVLFAIAAAILGAITGLPDRDDAADYLVLLLGATLGLMLMCSATHLLTAFLGLEMASLPSYALAGFLKGRKTGGEAALKYALYGAAASGVALFGISLLVSHFGTADWLQLIHQTSGAIHRGENAGVAWAGLAMLFAGLAFKLSLFPFHFWVPDVFEGAAEEVVAFLSTASKAAAVILTARFLSWIAFYVPLFSGSHIGEKVSLVLGVLAMITMTLGNTAALGQTNLKRLLAYSTIAHAGVLVLALATLTGDGVAAAIYYLAGYVPTNLLAFGVLAVLRDRGVSKLDDLAGLHARSPWLAAFLTVALLSLLGLPPLVGFAGKFQIFSAVYSAGGTLHAVALGVAVLNTAVSAGYYLKLVKRMYLDDAPDSSPIPTAAAAKLFFGLLAAAIVALGVVWDPVLALADRAATGLFVPHRLK